MTGERERLFGAEHPRAAAERGLGLGIVEPGIAAGDQQEECAVDAHRERLGDAAGLDPKRQRGPCTVAVLWRSR